MTRTDEVWTVKYPRTDWEVLQHRWVVTPEHTVECYVCGEVRDIEAGVVTPIWGCRPAPLKG